MQIVAIGVSIGIEIDDRGSPAGERSLLIIDLGMQLVGWPGETMDLLVTRGFCVLRMDNREAGPSQRLDHLGVPDMTLQALRHVQRATGPFSLRHQRHG